MTGTNESDERPTVSVIMPTYNHELYVEQAVKSVLEQDGVSLEVIAVDDASSDSTHERLMNVIDPRLTVIRTPRNIGCSGASKKGFSVARGNYIGWLASDDYYEPRCLKKMLAALTADPSCSLVAGRSRIVDERGTEHQGPSWHDKYLHSTRQMMLQRLFYGQTSFCTTACLMHRDIVEECGGFVDTYKQIDDLAFWTKVLFKHRLKPVDDIVVNYRWSSQNLNISAVTDENINRQAVEIFSNLKAYKKLLSSSKEMTTIFPQHAMATGEVEFETLLFNFNFAKLCLEAGSAPHRLMGLEVLYEIFENQNDRLYLEQFFGFGITEVFKAAGETQIFVQPRQITALGIVQKFLLLIQQLNKSRPYEFLANTFKSLHYPAGTRFFHLLDIARNGHSMFEMEQVLKTHPVFPCKETIDPSH